MDPVNQFLEDRVLTPLRQARQSLSDADSAYQASLLKFLTNIDQLYRGTNPFSGDGADAVAQLVQQYMEGETSQRPNGIQEQLPALYQLCESTASHLQQQIDWYYSLPWVGDLFQAGAQAQAGVVVMGSNSLIDALAAALDLGVVATIGVYAALVLAGYGEFDAQNKLEELSQLVIPTLQNLNGSVDALTSASVQALPPSALMPNGLGNGVDLPGLALLAAATILAANVHVLTPDERNTAVDDAWNQLQKDLNNLGKTMQDLINAIGDAALVKQIIQLLVCMGYSTSEISDLLTTMLTNTALNTPYSLPPGATGVQVTGSDTLLSVFRKYLDANAANPQDEKVIKGLARLIKAIMDIGPANIKGIDVAFLNASGGNSDADIITNNGDIYEIGGQDKVGSFGNQDIADANFIKSGGTGNIGGKIHLWVDVTTKTLDLLRSNYETGQPPNPGYPDPLSFLKWLKKPGFKKPADITQKTPPPWVCGNGYVVK